MMKMVIAKMTLMIVIRMTTMIMTNQTISYNHTFWNIYYNIQGQYIVLSTLRLDFYKMCESCFILIIWLIERFYFWFVEYCDLKRGPIETSSPQRTNAAQTITTAFEWLDWPAFIKRNESPDPEEMTYGPYGWNLYKQCFSIQSHILHNLTIQMHCDATNLCPFWK